MKLSAESFMNRLVCQKVTSIVQESGVPLGYFFKWYLRGPYCSSLADDIYAITSGCPISLEKWSLGEQTKAKLAEVKRLFTCLPKNNLESLGKKLELWSSILFLNRTNQIENNSVETLQKVLKANGKEYPDNDVREAVDLLKNHGFNLKEMCCS